jgi:hypothetical protein
MARVLTVDVAAKEIRKTLARSFQSGQVNFLVGSGASLPAIPAAGQIELQIAAMFSSGAEAEAKTCMYDFLASIQGPMNKLIEEADDANNTAVLTHYREYLGIVETILSERRTTLLPKQATIFCTNYDLFIEKAALSYTALKLNDGFSRVPSLDNRMEYSSRNFFNTTYNTGNLYNYKVEIPSINLIKLHGSLSWKKDKDGILFQVAERKLLGPAKTAAEVEAFINAYAVVLPQTTKFRTTLMDRTYYELLRIYANELDRENTLLVAFGFSFGDEHILDITRRALKNPTLRLVIFAFNDLAKATYSEKFASFNNVDIISPADGAQLGFEAFNLAMRDFLPKTEDTK